MKIRLLLAGVTAMILSLPANADSEAYRHWIARVGVHPVSTKPDSGTQFEIDNAAGVSLGTTYLFTRHWALELFAAFPGAHEMHDANGDRSGRFEMTPASVTVQYHLSDAAQRFRGYVGAGLAYAQINGERTKGAFAGQTLQLDDSTGVAIAIGVDMDFGSRWFINADARWLDIDSNMNLSGTPRDRLEIDPYLFGLSVGRRLR